MLPAILVVAGLGCLVYSGYQEDKKLIEQFKKEEAERCIKEEKVWNHGCCDKCVRRWKAHYFYPAGSAGNYQHISIVCHKCKRKSTLTCYKPPANEFNNGYEEIN